MAKVAVYTPNGIYDSPYRFNPWLLRQAGGSFGFQILGTIWRHVPLPQIEGFALYSAPPIGPKAYRVIPWAYFKASSGGFWGPLQLG